MNSLILHVSRSCDWLPQQYLLIRGGSKVAASQVVLETNQCWISVLQDDKLMSEYEATERRILDLLIHDPVCYLVEWRGELLMQHFVYAIPPDIGAVIDNDHGLICYVNQIREIPLANWTNAVQLS
jgi:hypothetical protein